MTNTLRISNLQKSDEKKLEDATLDIMHTCEKIPNTNEVSKTRKHIRFLYSPASILDLSNSEFEFY
jgi:hypothetical protein